MPGKLDDISEAIGALRATVRAIAVDIADIKEDIRQNRDLQSTRHGENRRDIEGLQRAVGEQGRKIDTLGPQVSALQIGFSALQMGRGKLATLAGVGLLAITVMIWALESGIQWIVAHLLRSKFGG